MTDSRTDDEFRIYRGEAFPGVRILTHPGARPHTVYALTPELLASAWRKMAEQAQHDKESLTQVASVANESREDTPMTMTDPYVLTAEEVTALKQAAESLARRAKEDRDLVFGSADWDLVKRALVPFLPEATAYRKPARVLTDEEREALAHARRVAHALTPVRAVTLEQVRIMNEALRPFKGKSPREKLEEQVTEYLMTSVDQSYVNRAKEVIDLVLKPIPGDPPQGKRNVTTTSGRLYD